MWHVVVLSLSLHIIGRNIHELVWAKPTYQTCALTREATMQVACGGYNGTCRVEGMFWYEAAACNMEEVSNEVGHRCHSEGDVITGLVIVTGLTLGARKRQ